tara:strand:+ start:73 stop:528 length:456 start_codon:yes stop_codon:yes gene_type:complete
MAQDPRNPKTPKIKTDFRKPTKFQADMAKKLEKRSKKTLNQTLKTGLKTPSKSAISKILRKMGPKGKAAAAILAGVGIGVGGSALMNKKKTKSVAKSMKAREKSLEEPARKKGPSGPSMTSMRAPSTGPKPRNKNVTKRPTRPSKQGSFGR